MVSDVKLVYIMDESDGEVNYNLKPNGSKGSLIQAGWVGHLFKRI